MSRITVDVLKEEDVEWFINTAAIRMLTDELLRPDMINMHQLQVLTERGLAGGTAFVAKSDGVCVGAIAGLLVPNIYNPTMSVLAEMFWYVLPEYRDTRAGSLLLSAFNEKGETCAEETTLSLISSSPVNISALEKRGFLLQEYGFLKRNRRE